MGVDVEAFFHAATNTITYLVSEPKSKQAAIIDSVLDFNPASGRAETRSAEALADRIEKRGLEVAYILETHVHADHLTAAQYLKGRLGGRIGIGAEVSKVQESFGAAMNAGREFKTDGSQFDILLGDGERLPLGDQRDRGHADAGPYAGLRDLSRGRRRFSRRYNLHARPGLGPL